MLRGESTEVLRYCPCCIVLQIQIEDPAKRGCYKTIDC